jgi:hypothetical protein
MRTQASNKKPDKDVFCIGSALILTVVLTSLLAVVGVLFVMVARVNKIATSAIAENTELSFAVDTVVAEISEQLALDVPGVPGQEYYDYPDQYNKWLADLEPSKSGGNYYWRQISDVTGFLEYRGWSTNGIPISNSVAVIENHKPIAVDPNGILLEQLADADGDGIADAEWVELVDITSGKGRPIYAAIRIVDNGGKLNVNTGFKFDPNEGQQRIDGSSQTQINVMALSWRPGTNIYEPLEETQLLEARANYGIGTDPNNLYGYEQNVTWRYDEPNWPYTPFDISDELELRYRFLLNHVGIDTRLENWGLEFRKGTISTPVTTGGQELGHWFKRAYDDGSLDPNYAYRHIATTYNMDRIINPGPIVRPDSTVVRNNDGTILRKKVNINTADRNLLYEAVRAGLLAADANAADGDAAQIAANIIDYRDSDSGLTIYDTGSARWYGFERPCIYISELAHRFVPEPRGAVYRSYAVELYKPYQEDPDPNGWQLLVGGSTINITNHWNAQQFCVVRNNNPNAALNVSPAAIIVQDTTDLVFDSSTRIILQRLAPNGDTVAVDQVDVPSASAAWLAEDGQPRSIQRDITKHKCIRRLWDSSPRPPTLGGPNTYADPSQEMVQAHPADKAFTNIGEIGMVFRGTGNNVAIGSTEADMRIDLRDPKFAGLFQYLTVIDPSVRGWGANEARVQGRINVNTAPWFVIAQLPWMNPALAQAIVAYRDKTAVPSGPDYSSRPGEAGFASIAELNYVVSNAAQFSMDYYGRDSVDMTGFPDLTPSDNAADDFEERDVIFSRVSNLTTVRSDVFTAYILVRIGIDGPQKRVLAIFDRSQVNSINDRVRLVALHQVADPR